MKIIKLHRLIFNINDDESKIKSEKVDIISEGAYVIDIPDSNRTDQISNHILEALGPNEVKSLDNVSTLYRYPNLSLSRDRVAFFCKDNDIKVIRNKNIADVRIISYKAIEKLMTYHWSKSCISVTKAIDIVNQHANAFASKEDQLSCIDQLNQIDKADVIDIDSLVRRYYYADNWNNTLGPMLDQFKSSRTMTAHWTVGPDAIDMFNELLNPTFKWILDENCNKLMSADSVALDDQSFIQIKDMLKSGGADDKAVAMNLMSNCDIESSKTYLAMLFFHFGDNMKGTKPWNTVGFKALRKGFQKYYDNTSYSYQHSSRYEKLISMLIEDDALTVPAMEHVLDLLFEDVVKKATGLSASKAFKLERSSISLTPEFAARVKKKSLASALTDSQVDLPF